MKLIYWFLPFAFVVIGCKEEHVPIAVKCWDSTLTNVTFDGIAYDKVLLVHNGDSHIYLVTYDRGKDRILVDLNENQCGVQP